MKMKKRLKLYEIELISYKLWGKAVAPPLAAAAQQSV